MHLSQRDAEGKPQRACTPQSHDVIRASEALFRTLTTPAGYQDIRDVAGGVLELGLCRNCGTTIARKMTEEQITMWELAIGDLP